MPPKEYVDVLIIGAGPAGLMCAHALAAAGVDVRIIDKRAVQCDIDQASGIAPRTIEVLQSYGLAERLIREGRQIHMRTFYRPGRNGDIEFKKREPLVNDPSARFSYFITLGQAAIEAIFIDSSKDHGLEIERPRQPSALEISQDVDELSSLSSYPVKVTVEHLDAIEDDNKTEIIYAKFVVGADGAHSWVRKTLGIEMEGEQTEYIWGVVDTVFETNFPDIRNFSAISSENGSCINIPREGDKNRLYIQLSDKDVVDPSTGRVDKSRMSPQDLLSVAKKILYPYELKADPECVEWWSIYILGQRVAASYSAKNRVFIVGDACHTHSPKAGQGMNAAINDTHNLAWKLVQVLRGWSSPSFLKTYESERRKFAQELINMDKELSRLFSEATGTAENADDSALSRALLANNSFVMGFSTQYSSSMIVDPKCQKYAESLVIGQRMPPQIFVRAADIHPIHIQDLLPADVRFKILFFVGNLTPNRITELYSLAEELSKPSSFLRKYSTDGQVSTVFDIVTIVAGKKGDVNFFTVPTLLRSHWTKVLLDDTDMTEKFGGGAYERFGIDPRQTTLVVVRPDGYVGTIALSNALADLDHYFGLFMVPRGLGHS